MALRYLTVGLLGAGAERQGVRHHASESFNAVFKLPFHQPSHATLETEFGTPFCLGLRFLEDARGLRGFQQTLKRADMELEVSDLAPGIAEFAFEVADLAVEINDMALEIAELDVITADYALEVVDLRLQLQGVLNHFERVGV